MIYLFESEISENKPIFISLTQIYGIGYSTAVFICKKLGFSKNLKTKDLSQEQIVRLVKTIEILKLNIASDLKKSNLIGLKNLISIKSYRGLRRNQGLPVRGQRTHTNARTAKKRKKKIMLNNNSKLNRINSNNKNKIQKILFFKEQFKYLKTAHSYHLVDPSPWPLVASLGAFMLTSGLVLYMHKFVGGWGLLTTGLSLILYMMYTWWRDIIREATFEDQHSVAVQKGLRLGMVLFIVSEIMFFFAFFWAFFHSSIAPVHNIGGVWPPKAISTISTFTIPLTNTFLLLTSGATVTWAHHALLARAKKHTLVALIFTLILAVLFTCLQGLEYVNAPFNISDGVYGSCFYMATGFHGFHVFVGTIALFVSFIRIILNHFTNKHHFGFESAIWYWHFVDVVWLFLFINVYWWSNK
jgi:cytochrome c oxidase subunit 3